MQPIYLLIEEMPRDWDKELQYLLCSPGQHLCSFQLRIHKLTRCFLLGSCLYGGSQEVKWLLQSGSTLNELLPWFKEEVDNFQIMLSEYVTFN